MSEDRLINGETRRLLTRASTATLTTQLFKHGLRNTFLNGLRPVNPKAARFVGEAFTLRYIPAREDLDQLEVFEDYQHPQRLAVETVPSGHVLVMDCRRETRVASAGSILITRMMKRGVAAVVSDGGMRDWPVIAELDFPVFAAAPSAPTNLIKHHAVDLNVPIACADVAVYPGDILVGDAEGVVVVPRHLAAEVALDAAEQERLECFITEKIRAGSSIVGVYPPNEATRAEYERWKAEGEPDD